MEFECPDQVIDAHVLPLLCVSLNPGSLPWAALSFLADPAGADCHVHVDADVSDALRNTFMCACREAHGYMMFSVVGPQGCQADSVALKQCFAAHCMCVTVFSVCHVA